MLTVLLAIYRRRSEPPRVTFIRAGRETLVSRLPTNGKVEPLEWQTVRAETAGLVTAVSVQEGQPVAKGAIMARLSAPGAQAELSTAEASVAEARAALTTVARGGRSSELAEIENGLHRARLDHEAAQRDYSALHRLEEKQAATRAEAQAAQGRLRQAEIEIESLERKRAALVSGADRAVAEARLRQAEAAVRLARRRMADAVVRAPLSGVVYSLPARVGNYVNIGDPIASVGRLDSLRVRVYVDEPELGRVSVGQPVRITWDAMPGREWQGVVDKLPAQIQTLGTRQVGEVQCAIDNRRRELVPGTNVNAEIRTTVAREALTIPRECLRRESGHLGVFVLKGDTIHWYPVKTGVSTVARAQITDGLSEGDAVALPGDVPLSDGKQVTPVFR